MIYRLQKHSELPHQGCFREASEPLPARATFSFMSATKGDWAPGRVSRRLCHVTAPQVDIIIIPPLPGENTGPLAYLLSPKLRLTQQHLFLSTGPPGSARARWSLSVFKPHLSPRGADQHRDHRRGPILPPRQLSSSYTARLIQSPWGCLPPRGSDCLPCLSPAPASAVTSLELGRGPWGQSLCLYGGGRGQLTRRTRQPCS